MRRLGLWAFGAAFVSLVGLAVVPGGCLPGDDRPVPGSISVEMLASDDVRDGFTTDDGWEIRFNRFLMGVSVPRLDGDQCLDYSFARYDRLFDFTASEGAKVVEQYGLGDCSIRFQIDTPRGDAILMQGATAADRDSMSDDDLPDLEGAAVWVVGRATKGGVTKTFDWRFLQEHRLNDCYAVGAGPEDSPETGWFLFAGAVISLELEARPRELFRTLPSSDAPTAFEPFALADADGDGAVNNEELDAAAVDEVALREFLEANYPDDFDYELTIRDEWGPELTLLSSRDKIFAARLLGIAGLGQCRHWSRREGGGRL